MRNNGEIEMRDQELNCKIFDYLRDNLRIELNQKLDIPDVQTYSIKLILTDAFGEKHVISETREFTTRF